MNFKSPKMRGERLIIVALLIILIAEGISRFWQLERLRGVLEPFGFLLLVVSLITTGVRTIRINWPSYKGITMTVIGLCLCAIPLFSVKAFYEIGKTLDYAPCQQLEKLKGMLDKGDLPLKSKIQLSKMYARDKYMCEGVIVDHLAETGEKVSYAPTKEDIDLRRLGIDAKQAWDYKKKDISNLFWTWIAITVISLLLGALTPIRKAPNMPSDRTEDGG